MGGDQGGPGGVLPGYYQDPSQDPYLVIFWRLGPTHGPVKAKFSKMMRFPEIGYRIDQN